jgi:hypothetical protein
MKPDLPPPRFDRAQALDESLAAWIGWFSAMPLPANLVSLIDQLEAAWDRSKAAPAPVAPS